MNLWTQEKVNKLQQAADRVYDKYYKEKGKLSS